MEAIILSTGTLNPRHLIPVFVAYLNACTYGSVEADALAIDYGFNDADDMSYEVGRGNVHGETLADLSHEVGYLMESHAPGGYWFGSHEGDGACIGFYPVEMDDSDGSWADTMAELEAHAPA